MLSLSLGMQSQTATHASRTSTDPCTLWVMSPSISFECVAAAFTALTLALSGCPGRARTMPDAGLDAASEASTEPDVVADMTTDAFTGPRPVTDCDPLMPAQCGLPWPSNLYLVDDSARATGFTLAFGPTSLPANSRGSHIDPVPARRLDGYGVGTPVMVLFPNLDIRSMAGEESIDRSMAPDAPVLWYEVAANGTVQRVPYWVELDGHEADPARQLLFVRPAVILREGTRYVVAFRALQTTTGQAIPPSEAFVKLRDGMGATDPALASRQARFDQVFATLESQGVARSTLTLAWDFVTASSRALHGRMLRMRDEGLARVGAQGPALTILDVTENVLAADGSGRAVDTDIAVELHGALDAPNYMRMVRVGNYQGQAFNLDANGDPAVNGTARVEFWVRIPWSALDASHPPHGLLQYGHGLLGDGMEVRAGYLGKLANDYHLIPFAANLTGMSADEALLVIAATSDLSRFFSVADALHQGLLQWMVLTRAMVGRFAQLADVTSRGVTIDPSRVYYSGNSQGGIFGGTFMALSPDIHRGHLGVPGNNYSTMLQRSQDFVNFSAAIAREYASPIDQVLAVESTQLLWNGTDPVSYLRHVTAVPFAGDSPHAVFVGPAKGDHQVAVLTNEILARSDVGIPLMAAYDNQRTPWNCPQSAFPRAGSGIVLYDFGNPWPAPGNHVPADPALDPHNLPRRTEWHNRQMAHFFDTGEIIDVCGGDGCHPN